MLCGEQMVCALLEIGDGSAGDRTQGTGVVVFGGRDVVEVFADGLESGPGCAPDCLLCGCVGEQVVQACAPAAVVVGCAGWGIPVGCGPELVDGLVELGVGEGLADELFGFELECGGVGEAEAEGLPTTSPPAQGPAASSAATVPGYAVIAPRWSSES